MESETQKQSRASTLGAILLILALSASLQIRSAEGNRAKQKAEERVKRSLKRKAGSPWPKRGETWQVMCSDEQMAEGPKGVEMRV